MKKFLNEFKAFAMRGNVVDMAVGVIIGGAFGKIVTSLVNDIIMPPIGFLLGGVNFKDLSIKLGEKLSEDGKTMEAVTVNYGNFIQQTVDFLIIAFCIFLLVKAVMKLTKKNEEEPEPAKPEPTAEEKLLTEIRDLLKNK
ncbi:large conductance mechanosensitive channel protein [Hoylesella buccalis ATCC 35310]|uniref:Large-conductance mechanosensitive channel n=1 Tax=Hoylesella buccalis ATCC 35310 TaxID=679190 RepID=D1W439_9BACT|nr:large-conductance mechanosensitive channel protein MscL [Hoylesella buccalis]EFA92718.1 large conductance mechanosensitive channel protein [Hoylesella buccalis ATCC 35310]